MGSEVMDKILYEIQDIKNTSHQTNQALNEIKEFQSKFNLLLEDHLQLKIIVTKLQEEQVNQNDEVNNLKRDLCQLKQEKLANNIVISGIPCTPNEDLNQLMSQVKRSLNLNDISPQTYIVERLLNSNKKGNSLLVVFNQLRDKINFIKRSKESGLFLNQLGFSTTDDKRVFIQDHLTPENYQLIRKLRQQKNIGSLKFVWLNNCIVVKVSEDSKTIQIKTTYDLNMLLTSLSKQNSNVQSLQLTQTTQNTSPRSAVKSISLFNLQTTNTSATSSNIKNINTTHSKTRALRSSNK